MVSPLLIPEMLSVKFSMVKISGVLINFSIMVLGSVLVEGVFKQICLRFGTLRRNENCTSSCIENSGAHCAPTSRKNEKKCTHFVCTEQRAIEEKTVLTNRREATNHAQRGRRPPTIVKLQILKGEQTNNHFRQSEGTNNISILWEKLEQSTFLLVLRSKEVNKNF